MVKRYTAKRVWLSIIGNVLLGIGVGCFRISLMGVDPYSSLILGLMEVIPFLSFGILIFCTNLILLVFGVIFERHLMGLGTIINLFVIGFVSDFTYNGWEGLVGFHAIWCNLIFMLVGVGLLAFGAAMYFSSDLGIGVYDSVGKIFSNRTRLSYRTMRMITDFTCLIACFLLGGKIGLGSVVAVVCIGPLIQVFTTHITNKWAGYPFSDSKTE